MEREEKVEEGERKGREFMGGKLKRGILVGKREGNCTPSPTWKFGLIKPDGSLIQDFNFPTNTNTTNLSARKLGANLWEVHPHHKLRMAKMSTNDGLNMIHYEGEKSSGVPKQLAEAQSEILAGQLTSGINLGKQVASLLAEHNQRVKRVGLAQQPASPSSYCSSMEMAPSSTAFTTNSSLYSKTGVSSYSLKTSTELLKVLNRIWSLEERHALDMSLVKTLRREVEQSQSQIRELLQEKKRDKQEIDNLTKQVTGDKVFRKSKEQERMKDIVKLVEEKLEYERKLRKHLESLYQKSSRELSGVEALLSNALKELEHEKKKRTLLEDLCDEFAKGVRDYEQEIRFLKQKSSMDQLGREGNDGLILHMSEAWLDERMQLTLADPHDNAEKPSVLDRLSSEIETFLQAKQSCCPEKSDYLSSKKTSKNNILRHSLESIHLNDPASAPWNANDEDDSVSIGVHYPQFNKVTSLKQGNSFNRQQEDEITSDDHPKETAKFKTTKKKVLPSAVSSLQTQLEGCVEEGKHHPVNDKSTKSITGYVDESNSPRMQIKGDVMQRAWLEGKNRKAISDVDLQQHKTARNQALTLEIEGKKLQREDNYSEGAFDPSAFTPSSPVKKWISEVRTADPNISETGSRLCQTLKPNTLKAKLLEARLEGQQSRTRASKASFQVD